MYRYWNYAYPCLQIIQETPSFFWSRSVFCFISVSAAFMMPPALSSVHTLKYSLLRNHCSYIEAAHSPVPATHTHLCTSRVVNSPACASQAPPQILTWRETLQWPTPGSKPAIEHKTTNPASHKLRSGNTVDWKALLKIILRQQFVFRK